MGIINGEADDQQDDGTDLDAVRAQIEVNRLQTIAQLQNDPSINTSRGIINGPLVIMPTWSPEQESQPALTLYPNSTANSLRQTMESPSMSDPRAIGLAPVDLINSARGIDINGRNLIPVEHVVDGASIGNVPQMDAEVASRELQQDRNRQLLHANDVYYTGDTDAVGNAPLQGTGPSSGMDYRNGSDVQDDVHIPEAARLTPQNLELARILKRRDNPYAVGEDGTMHYFNVDHDMGMPIALPGSRVVAEKRSDGVTVRQHVVDNPDGTVKVLGTDYGTPPEYVVHQPPGIGGDPVAALRRQVALSPQFAALAMQYIDPGSGQVDPARWGEFLKAAQKHGLRMTVTSNGLQNPYYQGMDNARAIAGGYPDSITVNVYNPSDTFPADVAESAKSMIFHQQQSVQVAIKDQMREALQYNKDLIGNKDYQGNEIAKFKTRFIGHSQGTINGNMAIDGMDSKEEQPNIQRYDIGRYYWGGTSPDIGKNIVINDQHDGSWFASAWLAKNEAYQNNPNRQYVWTDFNNDRQGETGNNHSLYLYLQRKEVQNQLGMTQPQVLTQPFVTQPPPKTYQPSPYIN